VMSYFQIVHAYGVQKFVTILTESGVSGLIIPDLPPEEDKIEGLVLACHAAGISFVPVISPNTSTQRIKLNIKRSGGLIYCTARQGITGQKTTIDKPIYDFLRQVEAQSSIAKAVGFGISKPSHIKMLIGHAEVAVIGSAIIKATDQGRIEDGIALVHKLAAAASTVPT
jgi:tryptophan synthase alpha subunit